jgi:hypothetical protein
MLYGKIDMARYDPPLVDMTDRFVECMEIIVEYDAWRGRTLARTVPWLRRKASLWVWRRSRYALLV